MLKKQSVNDRPKTRSDGVLVILFSTTLLLSAGLLFWIQPFVGKLLLPLLGGAPAVWNAAMLFFQAGLLAGYAYAHATSLWFKPNAQALVHLVLLTICLFWLPVGVSGDFTVALIGNQPPRSGDPVWWLLGVLTLSIGMPFAVLSASAPILQRWFSATNHVDAGNPYFLYAASNLGSMTALLGFPLVAEPLLDLGEQSHAWSMAFLALVMLTAGCVFLLRHHVQTSPVERAAVDVSLRPLWRRRLYWLVLVFATTSLMLGLTTYITTDVAAVPLLWVVPLALYLLTFVIAFARRSYAREHFARRLLIAMLLPFTLIWIMGGSVLAWPIWAFYLGLLFFVVALVCHVMLARLRPHSAWLTEFYLWMALGGVLGGVFNALLAPVLFQSVVEFPIMLVVAVGLSIWVRDPQSPRASIVFSVFIILSFAGSLAYAGTRDLRNENVQLRERNFFGALKVMVDPDLNTRMLVYGSTVHGHQATDPAFATEPLSYYGRSGPVGDVFSVLDGQAEKKRNVQVGGIGLGIGSVACYRAPGRQFTFFEINSAVIQIAKDTNLFTFLSNCPDHSIVEGDGRLALEREPEGKYDLLFVDAFTSDSIPVHLLTREAFELYMDKVASNGVLAIHISNRHMDLSPVVGAIVRDLGLAAVFRVGANDVVPGTLLPIHAAKVVVVARSSEFLRPLLERKGWTVLKEPPGRRAWTDDYSNILSALREKWMQSSQSH